MRATSRGIRWLSNCVRAEPGELPALLWSTAYFFFLLFGYFILRPVREAVGVAHGVENLHWLFLGTFLTMLVAVPIYGILVARLPRRRFVPLVHHFFSLCLLAFSVAFAVSDDPIAPSAARTFFVWVSAFNLFVVSVFWSVMTDIFTHAQSKRLFGFIAAGGTSGALFGSWFTIEFAEPLGSSRLLIVSTVCVQLAVVCMRRATRAAGSSEPSISDESRSNPAHADAPENRQAAIGGSPLAGIARVFRSPLLGLICGYLFLSTFTSTLLYFMVSNLVAHEYADHASRTEVFAGVNLISQTLTLTCQVFGTARILTRLGVGLTLAALPLTYIAGFTALAFLPLLAVAAVFEVLRRGMLFAVSKPALETLYTLVSREDRFKSKSFIDTVVYRGGDAAGASLFNLVRGEGVELRTIALLAIPYCTLWLTLAGYLRLAARSPTPGESKP